VKVALVSGNREKLPDPTLPVGLLSVMSNVGDSHSTRLIDLCFEPDPNESLAQQLDTFQPDLVGLGMRNLQSADYSDTTGNLRHYERLIKTIRRATSSPIVLGGSGFSVMPEALMNRLRPDYGISGEGEWAFRDLVETLERGDSLDRIGNLHRFHGDALVSNSAFVDFLDLNQLRGIDRRHVDPRYYSESGIDSVQTKRGCPLRCDYCTYPTIEGRIGRLRSPERVADEFLEIAERRPGPNHVFIVDSVFNLPVRHAKEVCQEMIRRSTSLPWTCYANPLGFDPELAEAMAEARCAGMEVGSDSGSDASLERLRKGFTTSKIRQFSAMARAHGIPDCHTFLLGTPGEEMDDVLRTLDFIVDLDPFGAILTAWVDDYEALDSELAVKRQALRESVLELLETHRNDFPWWSMPSLGVNYGAALFNSLRRRGFAGPLWQHMRKLSPATSHRPRPRAEREQGINR